MMLEVVRRDIDALVRATIRYSCFFDSIPLMIEESFVPGSAML